jgi:hypothetical protein
MVAFVVATWRARKARVAARESMTVTVRARNLRREAVRGDEAMQRGHVQARQVLTPVRTSARTQLNVVNMEFGGCEWTDGDAVKGLGG